MKHGSSKVDVAMGDIEIQVGALEGRIQSKQLEEFDNNFKRAEEGPERWLSSLNHVLSRMETLNCL